MADGKWMYVDAASNLEEADGHIVARVNESGCTEVAYMAYDGIRVVELNGEYEFADINACHEQLKAAIEKFGTDFEVALAIKWNGQDQVVIIDSMDNATAIEDIPVSVTSSVNYEADDMADDEMDQELLSKFDIMTA